ncbi:hypothetical protein Dthio_PD0431 [Desulfonatronospira thiodismutans ASO3-1]|uniref:Uncharacterized protein n=1 Tax=Desulfonatronospira thiodismutans ASO3-1 TaxID=555779 RepID=D6SU25_9BACT|nr:hypothetical protein Dthio_PD0431 [Desulfonatronospira thiodismutans ASO3-1]
MNNTFACIDCEHCLPDSDGPTSMRFREKFCRVSYSRLCLCRIPGFSGAGLYKRTLEHLIWRIIYLP